jgi:hypothetical protein
MTTSTTEIRLADAVGVHVTDEVLTVDLSDGRSVSVPTAWFPRLANATSSERDNWRFIGTGQGLHWPDLDEDLSVEGILAGRASARARGRWSGGWSSAGAGCLLQCWTSCSPTPTHPLS